MRNFPFERQLDLKDCGPACLKIVAKHYGKFYSLSFLRDLCGITTEGVSFLDISFAAEEIGLRTLSTKCSLEDILIKMPLPIIVHWESSHFVVVYKTKIKKRAQSKDDQLEGNVYVSDPAKGLIKYDIKVFKKSWLGNQSSGNVMAIEPQADFLQRSLGEKIERHKSIENFLGYFLPYKKSFKNLFVVMFLVTLLQGFLPFISKAVIDVGIQTRDIDFINIVLVANITIVISILLCNLVRDWILLHVTSRINIALISDYLIKLMRLPIMFFETKMSGDIIQRAQDHERIRSFIMNNSLNMLFSTLTFVVFGIIMFIYNPIIFYIFLIGSVLYVFWVMAFLNLRKKLDWEYFDLVSKNQSYWMEVITSIQDIKINNYEKQKRWKWEAIQAKLYRVNLRILSITNTQNLGAQFIDSIKNLLITFYCAKAVIAGEITFGVMISTQFIIGMLNAPVIQFIQFIISFQSAKLSFLRLNEIHQLRDESEDSGSNTLELPEDKSLHLKNLGFQYSKHGRVVLRNLNLVIPAGKVTAIVGNSGSGKSTLLKLLLRLYQPSHGEISVGNMNINNLNLRQWRDKCGAVMQDGKIFNDTILNNIVLDDESIDYERLRKALETANISGEIEALPMGYQTIMGEQGRGLSGGQKQRLLIARALYKNPDYLFFDEATNSLDVVNEQKIVSALDNVFHEKTVLVIAHRLSTIRKADQIVVMHDGTIAEIGNHNTLMSKMGRYRELVQAQTDHSENKDSEIRKLI